MLKAALAIMDTFILGSWKENGMIYKLQMRNMHSIVNVAR